MYQQFRPHEEEQKRTIERLMQEAQVDMAVGDTWYLVAIKWWLLWKSHVGLDEGQTTDVDPGFIDNAIDLCDESGLLKPLLMEGVHYHLVPQSVWKALISWYGGGPSIGRKVVAQGTAAKRQLNVEVYPLTFALQRAGPSTDPAASSSSHTREITISCRDTVGQLKGKLASDFCIAPHRIRLWAGHKDETGEIHYELLSHEELYLEDCRLVSHRHHILIDWQKPDDSWWISEALAHIESSDNLTTSEGDRPGDDSAEEDDEEKEEKMKDTYKRSSLMPYFGTRNSSSKTRGVCGLVNLGNTCFMNSALQCLSNTAPLTEYFLQDFYLSEINRSNPLGMKGEIAEQYGRLLKRMWSGTDGAVSPHDFKWALGKFAPQFGGYRQHDSQELLAFLLDGLHEDLNRIKQKPYVESIEDSHCPDHVLAERSWKNHLLRNQSIIVDLFQGQLKSTVVCPDCSKKSVTFDPVMYLSLPLAKEGHSKRHLFVLFFHQGIKPVRYGVSLGRNDTVAQMKEALAGLTGVPEDEMIAADVYHNRIYAFLPDEKPISQIRDSDTTHVYELKLTSGDRQNNEEHEEVIVQIVQRRSVSSSSLWSGGLVGWPRVMSLDIDGCTCTQLYELVYNLLKPLSVSRDASEISWPFQLHIISGSGVELAALPSNDTPIERLLPSPAKFLIAASWISPAATRDEESIIEEHKTVSSGEEEDDCRLSLNHCLQLFLQKERLGKGDQWYCPRCKDFKQATKKFDLWAMPDILVVHLKRFQYSKWSRDKLTAHVHFPLEQSWDLSRFVSGPVSSASSLSYDLFAVSNHSGGLGGGHYTAYARNAANGRWYWFNDSHVSEVQPSEVQSSAAYVLLYRRRATAPPF